MGGVLIWGILISFFNPGANLFGGLLIQVQFTGNLCGGRAGDVFHFVCGGLVDFPLCSNLHQLSRRVNYYFLFFQIQRRGSIGGFIPLF
jgi:hypothetical protein